MTEQQWLECANPHLMQEHLTGKVSDRKLRLFALACCRRVCHLLPENLLPHAIEAIEVVDELAGQGLTPFDWAETARSVSDEVPDIVPTTPEEYAAFAVLCAISGDADTAAWDSAGDTVNALVRTKTTTKPKEQAVLGRLLLCILGNPFRPFALNPAWLTWNDGTVRKLAQSIYDERAFDRLPILADALTDAGCHHADLLSHCRSDGPHVRGCWVVDLLLGKE